MTSPQDRRRAAALLGVPADAPAAAARAAFLRRLPAAGFVPPADWSAAVAVLSDRPARADGPAPAVAPDPAEAAALRAEVEAFAAAFWDTPPPERRRRWQELLDRCADDPPLAARLRRLEAGVDLPAAALDLADPANRLARVVQRLFVLRPAERAAERLRHLDGASASAARVLQARQPTIAALEPDLVERLAHWTEEHRARTPRRSARQPARASAGAGRRGWLWAWLLISLVTGVVRQATRTDHYEPPRPTWNVPPYNDRYEPLRPNRTVPPYNAPQPGFPAVESWEQKDARLQKMLEDLQRKDRPADPAGPPVVPIKPLLPGTEPDGGGRE